MISGDKLQLRIAAIDDLFPGLRHLTLVDAAGGLLPPAATGAHIQLILKGEKREYRNAYSLISKPGSQGTYEIIVRQVPESRGGSAFIHSQLKVGDELSSSWPGNLFAPARSASRHLLIAGGIGITPFLSYIADFNSRGTPYELHLCCRAEEKDVFAPWLPDATRVNAYWNAEGHRLDIPALLASQKPGTHLYVCGPEFLNEEVLSAAQAMGWPASHVHCERFGGNALGGEVFRAVLKTGKTVEVGANESLLEALERQGIEVPCLCRGGACGVCKTEVLAGEPEHRDHFLDEAEKASGRYIMPCVSRAKSADLTLNI